MGLFRKVNKAGAVIRILEVDDDCVHHICLDLETSQVEDSPVKPVCKIDTLREPITNEKRGAGYVDSEKGRCDKAFILDPRKVLFQPHYRGRFR